MTPQKTDLASLPNDFPEVTPPEAVETAKTWLKNNRDDFSFNANFILVDKDAQEIRDCKGQACHASVTASGVSCVGTSIGIHGRVTNEARKETVEDFEPFLKWFLYESPMGRFILNRDDYEFCRDYGIIVSGGVPQPIFQMIMITSRHFAEVHLRCFKEFNAKISEGYNPSLLYMTLFQTNFSYDPRSSMLGITAAEMPAICATKSGHRCFGFQGEETITNFLKGTATNLTTDSFFSSPSLHGVKEMFCENASHRDYTLNARERDKELNNLILTHRGEEPKSEGYRPPNPFAAKTIDPKEKRFTNEELVKVVVPYLQRKLCGEPTSL